MIDAPNVSRGVTPGAVAVWLLLLVCFPVATTVVGTLLAMFVAPVLWSDWWAARRARKGAP